MNANLLKSWKVCTLFLATIFLAALISGRQYIVLATVPVVYIFRDSFIPTLLCYVTNRRVALQIHIRENYVYIRGIDRLLVLYKITSLVSVSQLTSLKFVNFVRDFFRRLLSVCDTIVLVRMGDCIYMGFMYSRDNISRVRDVKCKFEDILKEFSKIIPVEQCDLIKLFKPSKVKSTNIFTTCLLSLPSLIFGLYGLVVLLSMCIMFYLYSRNLVMLEGSLNMFNFEIVKNSKLFRKQDPNDVKSMALCLSRGSFDYVLIVRSCRELFSIASQEINRAQEQLVVREKGRGYAEVVKWRTVIERISEGEEPLLVTIYATGETARRLESYFVFQKLTLIDFTPRVYSLVDDIAPLIPLQGIATTDEEKSIDLGVDKSGKPIKINLDSLSSRHIIIVGPTGMGKTRTCKKIIKQLLTKADTKIIIFDPHGEYIDTVNKLRKLRTAHLDVVNTFINVFSPHNLPISEKTYRVLTSIEEGFSTKLSENFSEVLEKAYSEAMWSNVKEFLINILRSLYYVEEKYIVRRILDVFSSTRFLDVENVIKDFDVVIIDFRKILHCPDVLTFLMLITFDTVYTYLASSISQHVEHMIVVDEAYYILSSKLLELAVRGFRKLGVGTLLITQCLRDAPRTVIENAGAAVILGGPDSYVYEIATMYNLSQEDFEWLMTAIPPAQGGHVRALLVIGPSRYHVIINVD